MAFITVSDVRTYIEFPENANEGDLENRIREAELLDISPQIGETLYEDLVANPGDTENAALIEKLKPSIAYYAYARHLEGGNLQATKYGIVKKDTPHSTPATNKELKERSGSYRAIAFSYIQKAITFIESNKADYTLYSGPETFKKPGLKIAQVKRT